MTSTYDSAGRLDYSYTLFDDGTATAVDYDQANTQPWSTYTVNSDAAGHYTTYAYVYDDGHTVTGHF